VRKPKPSLGAPTQHCAAIAHHSPTVSFGEVAFEETQTFITMGRHHRAKTPEQMLAGKQKFVTYLQGF